MFTGDWCGPCKVVKPVFEQLSKRKPSEPPVTFVLVDTTAGREVAQAYSISAVPTFIFFLDGKKLEEIKGADDRELRTQVGVLAMTAYPAHPHEKLRLHHLEDMSTAPVLYEQKPNLDAAVAKLATFVYGNAEASTSLATIKELSDSAAIDVPNILRLAKASNQLLDVLQPEQYFPLLDILKYAIINERTATVLAETMFDGQNLFLVILARIANKDLPKPTLITLLRLASNSLSSPILASSLMTGTTARTQLTQLLVKALLMDDKPVRTAAGSLAYSIVGWLRTQRTTWVDVRLAEQNGYAEQEDFEMELCTATVEALHRETEPEVG